MSASEDYATSGPFSRACCAAGSRPPSSAQNPAPRAPASTTLEPGDTIRIIVWRKPEFSGDFVIGQDGTITHPLYRAIKVGGVPIPQAEDDIRRFLSQYDQNPAVRHGAADQRAVSGSVPRPSVFAVQPKTSIAEAVARAGGPRMPNQTRVRIFRRRPGRQPAGAVREFEGREDPIGRPRSTPATRSSWTRVIRSSERFFCRRSVCWARSRRSGC